MWLEEAFFAVPLYLNSLWKGMGSKCQAWQKQKYVLCIRHGLGLTRPKKLTQERRIVHVLFLDNCFICRLGVCSGVYGVDFYRMYWCLEGGVSWDNMVVSEKHHSMHHKSYVWDYMEQQQYHFQYIVKQHAKTVLVLIGNSGCHQRSWSVLMCKGLLVSTWSVIYYWQCYPDSTFCGR